MSGLDGLALEAQMILTELRGLRDEVLAMHQETRATLVAIREMFDELRRMQAAEFNIEHELEDVSQRLGEAITAPGPSLTTCAVCGSDVQRHTAENGILLICKACGHTDFAERRSENERRTVPQAPAEGPVNNVVGIANWTSDQN